MGVPIQSSREIGSSMRLPIPKKIHEAIGNKSPQGQKRSFWNYNSEISLAFLSSQPLFDYHSFKFVKDATYYSTEKKNGDWDIRPKAGIPENVTSDYENDRHVFFMYENEWLSEEPRGVYILTTSDVPQHLPLVRQVKQQYAKLFDEGSLTDRKRPQIGGEHNPHLPSLAHLVEQSGVENIEEFVDQIYTTGRVETNLELSEP
jgi:hypothetical protein